MTSEQIIIENMSTAVLLIDSTLTVEYINGSAEILFAISLRQARKLPLRTLFPGEEDFLHSFEKVLETEQPHIEREVSLYVVGRGEVLVDASIRLINTGKDSVQILVELSQVDFQHRISRDESLQVQHQVVRGLAHEIKNPLGGLRGAAQLLERELDSDELKEYTSIIISEADRLQNLMTRMMGTHHQCKNTNFNIHEVLHRVQQLVAAELDVRLVFIADYDPSIPELYADFDQLFQVFLNIVKNATQAMNGVGNIILRTRVQRNLAIGQQQHRLGVRIDIQDDGPGIPEELTESIFYPLVTGRAEGTGLGLYLSQNLIQRNHGMIEYNSRRGQTVFSVFFPLNMGQ